MKTIEIKKERYLMFIDTETIGTINMKESVLPFEIGMTIYDTEKQKVVKNIRMSFDVQNPFTITNYSGLDPELNQNNYYPLTKSYVFGLNIGF